MTTNYKYDVFISYSRKDYMDSNKSLIPNNIISTIKATFEDNNITYWMDEKGNMTGMEYGPIIAEKIKESEVFLFICSENSVNSKWVNRELCVADENDKRIIPFICDDKSYKDNRVTMFTSSLDRIEYYLNPPKGLEKLIESIQIHKKVKEESPGSTTLSHPNSRDCNPITPITSYLSKDSAEHEINISLPDKEVPIIVFAGPKSAGKTSAMIRLCSYLKKKRFTVKPNPTFRPDSLYNEVLDAFNPMIESNLAPCRTSISGTILVDIFPDGLLKNLYSKFFKKNIKVCQMIDTSGIFFTNRKELPLFYHSILNAHNRIFWLLLADPELSDTDSKKAYAERVKYILNRRPETDHFTILLNKIDTTELMGRHGEIKDKQVLSFLSQEYPDLIELFKEKRKIIAFISPFDCDIVPFQTGSYGPDGHFVPSNDSFPKKIVEEIFEEIFEKTKLFNPR